MYGSGQGHRVTLYVPQEVWDRLLALAPRDGVLTAQEWVEVKLSRYVMEASKVGVDHIPLPVDQTAMEGARLRVIRRALSMRVQDMADAMGVSPSMVSHMETGRVRVYARTMQFLGVAALRMGDERLGRLWPGWEEPEHGVSPAPEPAPAEPAAAAEAVEAVEAVEAPKPRKKKPGFALPPELAEEPF